MIEFISGAVVGVGTLMTLRFLIGGRNPPFSPTEAMDMNVVMSVIVSESLEMVDEEDYPKLQYRVNEKLQEFFSKDAWIVIKDGEIHVPGPDTDVEPPDIRD